MTVRFQEFSVDQPAYAQACELRNRLLRIPLGLNLFQEDRSRENCDRHFGLWRGQSLVACLVITPKSDTHVKLRQMCVAADEQGQGLGRRLIAETERALKQSGVQSIELAARLEAQAFYEKLGFHAAGDTFVEVGILHIKMGKTL